MLLSLFTSSLLVAFAQSHEHHDHGHNHDDHHDHHDDSTADISGVATWTQSTAWSLPAGNLTMQLCPDDSKSGTSGLIIHFVSTEETGLPGITTATTDSANVVLNTFNSPRSELTNGDIFKLSNKSSAMLYRISMSNHEDHDHDHSSHDHSSHDHSSHDHSSHHHNHRSLNLACANGKTPVMVTMALENAGSYVLYNTPTLETFATTMTFDNTVLTSSACGHGCDTTTLTSEEEEGLTGLDKWLYSLLGCTLASMTALLGVCVLLFNKKVILALVEYMTSFAAGSLVATVVFHIYPESGEYLGNEPQWKQGLCFLAGILLGLLTEQGLHMLLAKQGVVHVHGTGGCSGDTHHHEEENDVETTEQQCHQLCSTPTAPPLSGPISGMELGRHSISEVKDKSLPPLARPIAFIAWYDLSRVKPIAFIVGMGDFMHAFTDGVLIAIAFQSCNTATGWLVTVAICVHEVPHRIADFFIFLKAGMTILQAVVFNFISSLSTMVGAILLLALGTISNETLGYMLAFGSGTLLFIAMADLMPSMMHQMDPIKAGINLLCFSVGTVVIGLTMLNHVHCHVGGGDHHHHHHH